MLNLHPRIADLKPSATVEMTEKIRSERAAGRHILSLSSGDPNIPTDPRIIEAATQAMAAGDTKYAPSPGIPALREAVAARELRKSGANYDPADILITPGGKFALFAAMMSFVGTGDEVLIAEPGWVSYSPIVSICGATPVIVPALGRLDIAELERLSSPHTRAIIVNSPVNPSGRVVEADEIQALVEFAQRHDIWIVFDQVYSDLLHEGEFSYPQSTTQGFERTIVIDSFSKTFGMTGWRLGYLALPPGYARRIQRLIQHSIYSVPGFIQAAGVRALSLYDDLVPRYSAMFRQRQLKAHAALNQIPGIQCSLPRAGFYLFPSVSVDDRLVASHWLEKLSVSSLPGSAFGAAGSGHLRLSVTSPDDELEEALHRISQAGLP